MFKIKSRLSDRGHQRTSRKILTALFICLAPGCGIFGEGETDTSANTDPMYTMDGKWIDCGFNEESGLYSTYRICVPMPDSGCEESDHNAQGNYLLRTHCARHYGGDPAHYPQAAEVDFDAGHGPTTLCEWSAYASDFKDLPEAGTITDLERLPTYGPQLSDPPACTLCNFCYRQAEGLQSEWGEIEECAGVDTIEVMHTPACLNNEDPENTEEPPDQDVWMCTGSNLLTGTMTDSFYMPPEEETFSLAGVKNPCVFAESTEDAVDSCIKHCDLSNEKYENDAAKDPDLAWSGFDCSELAVQTPFITNNPMQDCAGGAPMPGVSPGLVKASLSIATTPTGWFTSQLSITAHVDASIHTCTGGTCALSLDWASIDQTSLSGEIYDPRGKSYTYNITGIELGVPNPLTGSLDLASGQVTFPPGSQIINLGFSGLSVNDISLEGSPLRAITLRPTGGVYSGDSLDLELAYDTTGERANVTISVGLD